MTVDDPVLPRSESQQASPVKRPKIRVGVVVSASQLPAWQHAVVTRLASCDYAELVAWVQRPRAPAAARAGALARTLQRIVERLDQKMVCDVDATAAIDARDLLRALPRIDLASGDESALRAHAVDVFVDFTGGEVAALAPAATHGVWKCAHPYCVADDSAIAAFWPVYHGWPVGEIVIEQYTPDGKRVTLAHTAPATNPFSLKLNASALLWRISSLLPNKLRELHERGIDALAARGSAEPRAVDTRRHGAPGNFALAVYAGRNIARRARASLARRYTLDQWILLFRLGRDLCTNPTEFTAIVPPKSCFWADPHLVERDGRFYAFVEECPFDTGKGHIAVLALGDDGSWGESMRVLERDYHLSYPFVFEHQGELYMVPESEANRTVDLYRCARFPAAWEHVCTLLSGVAATDSTLLRHEGRWWLFTNLVDTPGASSSEELYIFHSDKLVGGEWRAHRSNPVISDARRARPAGAIIAAEGRLLRPAQDCSVRYGYGVRLQRIDALTEERFEETEIDRIEPTWDRRIVAVHSLSYVPGLTMLDALRPRLRFGTGRAPS